MAGQSLFVGRQTELAQLRRCLDDARASSGRVLFITGDLGIGKTSLLQRFCADARRQGVTVAQGRWYESREMPAYVGFSECLLQLLQDNRVVARLDRSNPYLSDVTRLGPEFSNVLGLKNRRVSDSSHNNQYRLWRGVSLVVRSAASSGPLVLALDDLQWADRGSLGLVGFLGQEVRSLPVLLVGAYRHEDIFEKHPLRQVLADLIHAQALETITLLGLSKDEVGALVAGISGRDVASGFVDALYRQTQGNPLFVVEMVRNFLASASKESPGRPPGAIPVAEFEVPEGISTVISRRLSRVSRECRRLLEVAAVIGRDFDPTLVEAAGDLDKTSLLRALDEAVAVSVMTEAGAGLYAFSHPLMRTVVYQSMSPSRRATTHLRVADALESRSHGSAEQHVREIARHLMVAAHLAEPGRVARECLQGARQARRVFDHNESRELLLCGLRCLDQVADADPRLRAEMLMELAYAERALGRPDDAVALYRRALEISDSLKDEELATGVRRWLAVSSSTAAWVRRWR